MRSTFRSRLTACSLFLLVACGNAESGGEPVPRDPSTWYGRIDTARAGPVVVRNLGGGAWERDTVRAVETLRLGGGPAETRPEYAFGRVSGLAVDGAGRLYVADALSSTVRAYGPEGEHLALLGAEGSGPGEFTIPRALWATGSGVLYVADQRGVTRLVPREEGALPDSVAATWPSPVPFPHLDRPFRVSTSGVVYWPDQHTPSNVTPGRTVRSRHFYLRLGPDGGLLDTLEVPTPESFPGGTPFYLTRGRSGRMIPGVDHVPFAPLASWDVTRNGKLIFGTGELYELLAIEPTGDTVARVLREGAEPGRIPERIRRDSLAALRARLDSLPVPVARVIGLPEAVRRLELPETYPAHGVIRVGTDGRIWVARWLPVDPEAALYDVLNPNGIYLGTVLLPSRFTAGRGFVNARVTARPLFTPDAVYGVVEDPVTGVEQIVRYGFIPPPIE